MFLSKKIEEIYKSQIFTRCDDSGKAKYFSGADFEGLSAAPYEFDSSLGHKLRGYFYSYECSKKSPLIIFEHGLGGGHLSYMKEIELLCSEGYTVFSYDHTGCMRSEGKDTNGLAQSLHDLDDCLTVLKNDENVDTSRIFVIGHSWGGFSSMNIAAFHPDVEKIVVISGFLTPAKIIEQNLSGVMKLFRRQVFAVEQKANPGYADINGVETLQKSDVPALFIYSDNDPVVRRESNYDILKKELPRRPNTIFHLEHEKGHNPHYTRNAVALLAEYSQALVKAGDFTDEEEKQKFRNSFDWDGMTEQDPLVWKVIFDFFEGVSPHTV